jgi:Chromo (CHRromatin Organisation MOdifier) domain
VHANDVYDVEKLIKTKGSGTSKQYLVRWKKIDDRSFPDEWIKKDDITQNLIDEYHQRYTMDGNLRRELRRVRKH